MNKVTVFVEGQTELVFVRQLLFVTFGYDSFSIECLELRRDVTYNVPFKHNPPSPKLHIQLIDCGNDEKVIQAIKDSEANLVKQGYTTIIGLRDMYSKAYDKRSGGVINNKVSKQFIDSWNQTIAAMSHPNKIKIFPAIMETEAWILGMYKLFPEISPTLTSATIAERVGYELSTTDPQATWYKPQIQLNQILQLVNAPYKKKKHDIESIVSHMKRSDIDDACQSNRCSSLKAFFDALSKCMPVSKNRRRVSEMKYNLPLLQKEPLTECNYSAL